jgi:hypothetical protein
MPGSKVMQVKVVGRVTLSLVGLALMLLLDSCGEASRAPQEETAKSRSTSSVRLELSPTNNSGVGGSATLTKAGAGTRVELKLWGLPEPNEIYLAHMHPGSCEDAEHSDVLEGDTAYHHDHEHGHDEHTDAHEQEDENVKAPAEEIEQPLTPVESNAAGQGSSTTMLEGVALGELLSDGSRYLNVHAAGSGDPPQLTCANVREARLRTTSENNT